MSSKNAGKPLTAELVFTKTKSDSLHNIKNLNLWGNDLEDLQLIEKMPNLEVVSLSVNRISTLRDFSKCAKLQVNPICFRNCTCARITSWILDRSNIWWSCPTSRYSGSTTTPALRQKTIEKSSSNICPISSNSIIIKSPRKREPAVRRLSSMLTRPFLHPPKPIPQSYGY